MSALVVSLGDKSHEHQADLVRKQSLRQCPFKDLKDGPQQSVFEEVELPRWIMSELYALARLKVPPSPRMSTAVGAIRDKMRPDGTWTMENSLNGM